MTVDEWKYVLQIFGAAGIGAVALGAILFFVIRTSLSSYFSEKGKNLATKEDIEQITRTVEGVKSELQARHTLRFAALEKRLEAHQEAFGLFRNVLSVSRKTDEFQKAVNDCSAWYDKKGLYLEPKAQRAFWDAFAAASEMYLLGDSPEDRKVFRDNWKSITSAITVIAETIGLPPIKGDQGLPAAIDIHRSSDN